MKEEEEGFKRRGTEASLMALKTGIEEGVAGGFLLAMNRDLMAQ